MKSCFGSFIALITVIAVIATGALIWYLSGTAEFSRKEPSAPSAPAR